MDITLNWGAHLHNETGKFPKLYNVDVYYVGSKINANLLIDHSSLLTELLITSKLPVVTVNQ